MKVKARLRKRLGWGLIVLATLAAFWGSTQQLPFVIVTPGPVYNVLDTSDGKDVITIYPSLTDQTTGTIDLLTISEYGKPGATPYLSELIVAFFSEDSAIYPLEMIYPVGVEPDDLMTQITKDFELSQQNAIAAAGTFLDGEILKSHKVTFGLAKVGGPSGGLAFTLGIIDKLSSGSLTGGKRIAVTGTIASNGDVGAIGGIRQKVFAANRAGDKFLLIPKGNCGDLALTHLNLIRVVPVSNLTEALSSLRVISSDGERGSLPVCTAE